MFLAIKESKIILSINLSTKGSCRFNITHKRLHDNAICKQTILKQFTLSRRNCRKKGNYAYHPLRFPLVRGCGRYTLEKL